MSTAVIDRRVFYQKVNLMRMKLYFIALISFLAIDSLWLGLVAPKFYRSQIGHLMAETPNLFVAGIFYLLFVVGLVLFVIEPGMGNPSFGNAVLRGAFFGLVTYATYDLTNQATVTGWPVLLTIVDLLWGTFLSAVVTGIAVWAGKRLKST
jgi:uncharacterized membrane protein